jgi:citrate lyase subunit beta/citryl-CoA lyase
MTPTSGTTVLGQGEAGREGTPSDLRVRVTLRNGGGVSIQLQSKVRAYYGRATAEQARRVLSVLNVDHADVTIDDQGALPFTIAARIEAAVRRAGGGAGARALAGTPVDGKASPRGRRRRSRLYLPGSEPKFFINARIHGADAVILDLEDSVHPDEKDAARILVRNALREVDFGSAERMVRINQLPLGLEDLDEVVPERPNLILLPKAETPDAVRQVDAAITRCLEESGLDHDVWLMPILESALGVENAFAIAGASPRVAALTVGLEDLTADLGVPKTAEGAETLYARSRLVNAAHAARVQAIDSVYGDVEDIDGLRRYGERSRAMGFEGMGCIHPRQIPVIHAVYAPGAREIEKAARIVAAFEEARARGLGVVSLGTKMIDPPVVARAQRILREARELGLVPGETA